MNTTELKALAEKATPGEWEVGKCLGDQSRHIYCVNPVNDGEEQWLPLIASTDDAETLVNFEANATYIAAANPAEILELIAQLEDAQGEIRALRATEAGLRAQLESPIPEIDYEALIAAAFRRDRRWAQGTNGCIAFAAGAEWFRALLEKKE